MLPDGTFGLTTIIGGFLIVDRYGTTRLHMNKATGLPADQATGIFVNRTDMVWLALLNGICQIETTSSLTRFDASAGMPSITVKIIRHNGILHIASFDGVHYLDAESSTVRLLPGLLPGSPQSWSFAVVEGQLLAGVSTGLYRVHQDRLSPVKPNVVGSFSVLTLGRSRQNPRRVWVGTSNGLATLRLDDTGQWVDDVAVAGIDE